MALSQSIATPYGVEATYWTIASITVNRKNLTANILLEGYASESSSNEKSAPLSHREYFVKFSETPGDSISAIPEQAITPELVAVFETLSQFGYGLVKQVEEFNSATDI